MAGRPFLMRKADRAGHRASTVWNSCVKGVSPAAYSVGKKSGTER